MVVLDSTLDNVHDRPAGSSSRTWPNMSTFRDESGHLSLERLLKQPFGMDTALTVPCGLKGVLLTH